MKMIWCWYEIFLGSSHVQAESWQALFAILRRFLGWQAEWQIYLQIKHHTVHYYLRVPRILPSSLGLSDFLFKNLPEPPLIAHASCSIRPFDFRADDLPLILHKLERRNQTFCWLECRFRSLAQVTLSSCSLVTRRFNHYLARRLLVLSPAQLFSIDYEKARHLRYKKIPKYLDSEKIFRLVRPVSGQTLLLLDTFPYGAEEQGIELADFDFAKHSLVIGGSGSGKSRFLSLLISRLYQHRPSNYKVIVIDPHDALKYDLGEVEDQTIIDFRTPEHNVDLFQQELDNLSVSVELMLETFKSLIGESYNGRLERVLRHSIYLLLLDNNFTFSNLRRLLSDIEYRTSTLAKLGGRAPSSVSHFFLTEFQELRSQAYNTAFAPIMAFIDEMQMVPVMNQDTELSSISATIETSFLTVFSLNRLFLGDKPTRVIAGLLMQQIFLFAQQRTTTEHLLVVIDEVAVVENPILMRFLSEMRKYNVSVILAGQYFGQISPDLRAGILANVSNYYIFRVSRSDADLLSQNLQLKLIGSHGAEDEQKLFTGLKARECLVQLSCQGELYSLAKAHTPDHCPPPNKAIPTLINSRADLNSQKSQPVFAFSITTEFSALEIMQQNSTNRKPLKLIPKGKTS